MPNYKVVDADKLDADLSAIGDAIRSKTGGTDPMTLDEMAVAVEGIQMGSDSQLDALIDGSITEVKSGITTARSSTFAQCKSLTSADFPNLTIIPTSLFNGCSSLKIINIPNAIEIGNYAFNGCSPLEKAEFPLTLTRLGTNAFNGCSSLQSITLKLNIFVGSNTGASVFEGCASLHTVIFSGSIISLSANFFKNCVSLKTLVIRDSTGTTPISSTSVFTGTPFAEGGTGGTVYVPAALIERYQTATNWSTLYAAGTCNFVAIEGSEYE